MKFVRKYPVIFYFSASLIISYIIGIVIYLLIDLLQKHTGIKIPVAEQFILKFGPSLAGILTIGLLSGRQGLTYLFQRCIKWRFSGSLYFVVLVIIPLITVLTILFRGYGEEMKTVSLTNAAGVFGLELIKNSFYNGGLSEEIGWRGFMLPKLLERYTPFTASILVGIAWFAWHVPAYFISNKNAEDPILPFAVFCIAASIVMTWATIHSKYSILVAMLIHGSLNAAFYSTEKLLPQLENKPCYQPGFDWVLTLIWCLIAISIIILSRFSWNKRNQPGQDQILSGSNQH